MVFSGSLEQQQFLKCSNWKKGILEFLVNDLIASKMIVTFMMIAQCWVGFHRFSPPPRNSKFVTENQRS